MLASKSENIRNLFLGLFIRISAADHPSLVVNEQHLRLCFRLSHAKERTPSEFGRHSAGLRRNAGSSALRGLPVPKTLSKIPRQEVFAPMPRTREPMRAYARLAKSLTWLPAASACRHLH